MSLAIIYPGYDTRAWVAALHDLDPALQIEVWPEIRDEASVEFALCWNQPAGLLQQFPNLKGISSLGAGVNHLLDDATRPGGIPLARLVDRALQQSMAEYVILGTLEYFRQFKAYRQQQAEGLWRPLKLPQRSATGVGIMGMGCLGTFVAGKLHQLGFRVSGWSRSPRQVAGVTLYCGRGNLDEFLATADILVCLLPLTAATTNILCARTFARLPTGAYLINVARGQHLVEDDLLTALATGQLAGALLDVFRQEPLPAGHPFWAHDKIMLTPHIASITDPRSAAPQVIENYRRTLRGEPLLNLVDPAIGY